MAPKKEGKVAILKKNIKLLVIYNRERHLLKVNSCGSVGLINFYSFSVIAFHNYSITSNTKL